MPSKEIETYIKEKRYKHLFNNHIGSKKKKASSFLLLSVRIKKKKNKLDSPFIPCFSITTSRTWMNYYSLFYCQTQSKCLSQLLHQNPTFGTTAMHLKTHWCTWSWRKGKDWYAKTRTHIKQIPKITWMSWFCGQT